MPGGRPSKLTQVVRHDDDGNPVTAGEQVVAKVRLGMELQAAADAASISRDSLHRWQLAGARFRALQAQGKLPRPTAQQAALIEFTDALESAHALAEADALAVIHAVGEGGIVLTKTTRKVVTVYDEAGVASEREVERTITTETTRPEWTAKAWYLERKRGYVKRMEVTGEGGTPLVPSGEAARDLAESLREFQDSLTADETADAAATVKRAKA